MSIKQAIEALEACVWRLKSYDYQAMEGTIAKGEAALAALRSMPAEPVIVEYMIRARWPDGIEQYLEVHGVHQLSDHKVGIDVNAPDGHPLYATPHTALLSDAWISVDERLPGEQGCDSEDVMLFINGHCDGADMDCRQGGAWGLRFGYFDAEKQAFRVDGLLEWLVTHWQPLPPSPIVRAAAALAGESQT